jgi:hypothetical protein
VAQAAAPRAQPAPIPIGPVPGDANAVFQKQMQQMQQQQMQQFQQMKTQFAAAMSAMGTANAAAQQPTPAAPVTTVEPTLVTGWEYHTWSRGQPGRYVYVGKCDTGQPEFLDYGAKGASTTSAAPSGVVASASEKQSGGVHGDAGDDGSDSGAAGDVGAKEGSASAPSPDEPIIVSGWEYHDDDRFIYIGKDDDGVPEFMVDGVAEEGESASGSGGADFGGDDGGADFGGDDEADSDY